jgi:hypothetical protein
MVIAHREKFMPGSPASSTIAEWDVLALARPGDFTGLRRGRTSKNSADGRA